MQERQLAKKKLKKKTKKNNNTELAAVRMCKSINLISQLHHWNVYFIKKYEVSMYSCGHILVSQNKVLVIPSVFDIGW